ncbi:Elongation of very long chain fatty acid protein [Taenia solium]|eukprot:TsM_000752600 transcript=TsM_000752600 gene=TsM_000752600
MPKGISERWMPLDPDPRSAAYPLMESFWPTALISLAYVVGVYLWMKIAAPKKKKATTNGHASNGNAVSKNEVAKVSSSSSYDTIKVLMVVYNIAMVFYSAFLVIEVLDLLRITGYGLGCVEFDPKDDPVQRRFIRVGYLFYFSKFLELLDTLFFLLRGKYDQVTFLHVFHHGAMPPSIWWGIKYAPGGIVYMFPLANSFVHVIMYTYYGMAALGLYRYLWWKKYLTVLQMVQFCIFIVHQGQVLTPFNWECRYPKVFPLAIVIYAVIFLVLFSNFYVQAYWRKRRLAKRVDESNGSTIANGKVMNHRKAE